MNENKCIVCGDFTVEEVRQMYKKGKSCLCDKHVNLDMAKGYCMNCETYFGMDRMILSMLSGRFEFLKRVDQRGVLVVSTNSCIYCRKTKKAKTGDNEYFLFQTPTVLLAEEVACVN